MHTHHNFEIASSVAKTHAIFISSVCVGLNILVYLGTMELLSLHHVLENFFFHITFSTRTPPFKSNPKFSTYTCNKNGGNLGWF